MKLVIEYTLEIEGNDYEKIFGPRAPKGLSEDQVKKWHIMRFGTQPILIETQRMMGKLGLTRYVLGPFSIAKSDAVGYESGV